jgi:hypothetical protein
MARGMSNAEIGRSSTSADHREDARDARPQKLNLRDRVRPSCSPAGLVELVI